MIADREGASRGAFFVSTLRGLACALGLATALPAAALDCLADRLDEQARVDFVYDGDTIRLHDGRKVRLIGINAPEIAHPKHDRPARRDEPYSREARRAVIDLIPAAGTIGLRIGRERRDRYGRLLAHVYLPDGRSLEGILLSRGLAMRIAIPPNTRAQDCYARAEHEARRRRIGLWADPYYRPLASDALPADIAGFHRIQGRVVHVGRSRRSLWLDMPGGFAVRIPRSSLDAFAPRDPGDWLGRTLVVRGWIHRYRRHPIMTIRHPSAIEDSDDVD